MAGMLLCCSLTVITGMPGLCAKIQGVLAWWPQLSTAVLAGMP